MHIVFSIALVIAGIAVNAQPLKIKNYSAGYRVFEVNATGNNPLTIAPLLKDPGTYLNYINSIQYTGLNGNPAIQRLANYYLNIEFFKNTPSSRFWKKYTIQTGLFISNRLIKDGLSIENQKVVYAPPDTIISTNKYSLTQKQQFLGMNAGLNRRFRISGKLQFLSGLHLTGSFAAVHNYKPQWDSTKLSFRNGRTEKTTSLPGFKGKSFFQWQAMIPICLEMDIYRKQLFIRAEADAGIIGGHYRPKTSSAKEALGIGLWLIYQRK